MGITRGQMRKIWAMAREVFPAADAEDLLRGLVKELTGSDHISTLSAEQAARVIDALTKKATSAKRQPRPGMASDAQLRKIKRLAHELGWGDNPQRLRGFLRKFARVEREEWLMAAQAWRVIEGLKAQLNRRDRAGNGTHGEG